jgi:hypothetical protein
MKSNYKIAATVIDSFVLGVGAASVLHAQVKPLGYYLAEIDVKDQDGYTKDFLPKAEVNTKEFGDKYIAGGFNKAISVIRAAHAARFPRRHFCSTPSISITRKLPYLLPTSATSCFSLSSNALSGAPPPNRVVLLQFRDMDNAFVAIREQTSQPIAGRIHPRNRRRQVAAAAVAYDEGGVEFFNRPRRWEAAIHSCNCQPRFHVSSLNLRGGYDANLSKDRCNFRRGRRDGLH